MGWLVYIRGDDYDLDVLRRGFASGDLVIDQDDNGTYVTGPVLADYDDRSDALAEVRRLLPALNGVARTAVPGFESVETTGQFKDSETGAMGVHVDVTFGSTVRLRAEGRVSVNGVPVADTLPETFSKLWAASQTPSLEAAIAKFGSMTTLNWVDLYKIFELVRKAAGNQTKLSQKSGVTEPRISSFTWNANHPDLGGAGARHAVLPGEPTADDKISIEDGREIIRDLLNGMQAWNDANPPSESANSGS